MSFNDADMYNGFSVGYDEYPSYMSVDEESILSNRAYKTGEVRDSLYPLMNAESQSKYVGSGPLLAQPPMLTIGDIANKKKDIAAKSNKSNKSEHLVLEPTPTVFGINITMTHIYIFLIIVLAFIAYMQYTQYTALREMLTLIRSVGLLSVLKQSEEK